MKVWCDKMIESMPIGTHIILKNDNVLYYVIKIETNRIISMSLDNITDVFREFKFPDGTPDVQIGLIDYINKETEFNKDMEKLLS